MAAESARAKASHHQQIADRYGRGADGEEATAEALAALDPQRWVVLHDVAWPGRRLANLDHVAIGPSGVFVIDSKNWSGRVAIEGGVLRQNGRARTTTVTSAEGAASAVADVVPQVPHQCVRAVLTFTAGSPTQKIGDVLVCTTETLIATLTAQPTCLAPEQVKALAEEVRKKLTPATDPRRKGVPAGDAAGSVRDVHRSPRASRSSRRTRRRRVNLVGPVAGLVFGATMLLNPGLVSAGAQRISDLLVDQFTPTVEPIDAPVKPTEKPVRKKQQRPSGEQRAR